VSFFQTRIDIDYQLHYLKLVTRKKGKTMIPLSQCPRGSKVKIVTLCDDTRCRCRLCALGLTPGVEAEVCEGGDSCRLNVRGGVVCLGAGLAGHVMVTPV